MAVYIRAKDINKWTFTTLPELAQSGANIGITLGYSYGNEFDKLRLENAFKGEVTEVISDVQNIHKLSIDREDAILVEQFVGPQLIKTLSDTSQKVIPHPLKIQTGSIHFMFSKKSVSLEKVEAFNQALERIRANGEYQRILNKYLKPDQPAGH